MAPKPPKAPKPSSPKGPQSPKAPGSPKTPGSPQSPKSPKAPKSPAEQKAAIKEQLRAEIEAQRRKNRYARANLITELKEAFGVGNFEDWRFQAQSSFQESTYVKSTAQLPEDSPRRPRIKQLNARFRKPKQAKKK